MKTLFYSAHFLKQTFPLNQDKVFSKNWYKKEDPVPVYVRLWKVLHNLYILPETGWNIRETVNFSGRRDSQYKSLNITVLNRVLPRK
jgi:hypothetical protein